MRHWSFLVGIAFSILLLLYVGGCGIEYTGGAPMPPSEQHVAGQDTTPPDSQMTAAGEEVHEEKARMYGGLLLGGGSLAGGNVSGFGFLGLKGGGAFEGGRVRVEIQGLSGSANLREESDASASIKDEFSLGWGFAAQYLLTEPKTFMGLYIHLGFRESYLFWDYAKPFKVKEDGDEKTVDQDILKYTELYAGLGVSLARFKYGQIGVNGSGGFRYYSDTTDEGLENDLFGSQAFVQVMLDVVFGKFK